MYVILKVAELLVSAMILLLFVHAILSWIPMDEDNPIISFLDTICDPITMLMRSLFDRFDLFTSFPIDLSYTATFLILILIRSILRAL